MYKNRFEKKIQIVKKTITILLAIKLITHKRKL